MILYHYYYLFGRLPFEILVNRHNTFQMLEFPVRRPGRPRFPSLVRRQLYSLSPATTWRTLLLMPLCPRFRIPIHTKSSSRRATTLCSPSSRRRASYDSRLSHVHILHLLLPLASTRVVLLVSISMPDDRDRTCACKAACHRSAFVALASSWGAKICRSADQLSYAKDKEDRVDRW